MLTIEEKIRQLEAIAESGDELYADYEEHGLQDTCGARRAKSLIEEKRQEIAWLRELQERRKAPEIVRCGECEHKKDHHYEEPGEEPHIKSTCENKYGLTKGYQVHDWDFCSRAERRTDD